MGRNPQPAIRTAYDERYESVERIEQLGADTNFHRGLGETGEKVYLVDASDIDGCPRCNESELILSLRLSPDSHDDAMFYCTNPFCRHFVSDALDHVISGRQAEKPTVWDNTAYCPECESRHTIELSQATEAGFDVHTSDGHGKIYRAMCDECNPTQEAE